MAQNDDGAARRGAVALLRKQRGRETQR